MQQDQLLPNEQRLMPMQTHPTNGDYFVTEEFLKLKEKFNITTAVELGSCVGGTTKWFGENFEKVHTIEIQENFLEIAKERCKELNNISFHLGSTIYLLDKVLAQCDHNTILFVDSHWSELPLFDELKLIKASGLMPVIAIHDFKVPEEPLLGFDSYNGIDISFDNIKKYLDDIYGSEDGYDYHYNTADTSTEVKRGVCYIYPRIK